MQVLIENYALEEAIWEVEVDRKFFSYLNFGIKFFFKDARM